METNKQILNFLFLNYQVSILIQQKHLVLKQHFGFQRTFQPHLKNYLAEELNIHRKKYQDKFLKIRRAAVKDHNSLCKLFQKLQDSNMIYLNFFLQLILEYFI